MKRFAIAFAAIAMMTVPATAATTRCHDAKGKFIKCPPAAPATHTPAPHATPAARATPAAAASHAPAHRCRNAKGQFAKCGTPGSHPG